MCNVNKGITQYTSPFISSKNPNQVNSPQTEMVSHSTVKSRRRPHKVTRKPRMHPRLRVLKNLNNSLVKQFYDNEKLPVDNLIALGLETNANGIGQPRYTRHPEEKEPEDAFPGFLGYVETLPPSSAKPRNVLPEMEMEYIEALIAKHGDNCKAMERDMKLNTKQYTELQLKRLVKRYQELNAESS